jgi:hypothetical protein
MPSSPSLKKKKATEAPERLGETPNFDISTQRVSIQSEHQYRGNPRVIRNYLLKKILALHK